MWDFSKNNDDKLPDVDRNVPQEWFGILTDKNQQVVK